MQKTFEFFIILIIFYGVYSAFDRIAPMLWDNPSSFWVVIVALVAAALILMLYSVVIRKNTATKYKKDIDVLKHDLEEKDKELKDAFKIKHDVQEAAEASMSSSEKES